MMPVGQLLATNRIVLRDLSPGRHYTVCPQCSAKRTKQHQAAKCLGVTIANGTAYWGCNHCQWTGPEKRAGNGAAGPELTTYEYRDADGELSFRKVRNAPGRTPRFWLERPDGNGGWRKGTSGVDTQILYRLDEIAKAIAAGRPVCVVEGEKDADNLWRLDIPATTIAHGASEPWKKPKWRAQHSAQLSGADLIILNDNDAAGYAHAEATCRLSLGIASRIRRLDLKEHWPEIAKGGDVSDWLAVGHGREELAALIDAAPDYTLPAQTAPGGEGKPESGEASGDAEDDDAALARLAKLPLIEYERARADEAKRLGCRAPMLDRLVASKRVELGLDGTDGKQGRPIEFASLEPWPERVNGPELLEAIAGAIGLHVVMSEHQRVAIALWVVHAYLLERLMISPRLAIRSAVKGSGKTTCLDVLARLVPRPLSAASVTPSAIFRVIAAHAPTVLIDEADTLFHDGDETLRGVLNAGHRKGGAVLRSVGDDFEPRAFSCYAGTVIALIGQLPGPLADRSIDVVLTRRRPSEPITPFRLDQTAHLDVLARQIARWAKDNGGRIGHDDPVMPPGLYNRQADNWRGLVMIADAAGGRWPEKARQAAVALVAGDVDEVSRAELLLGDIRAIFISESVDEITSAQLIEKLCEIVPRPWAEYGKSGKPITPNKLARLLKPLGIGPGLIGPNRLSGYRRASFAEAFERYLAPITPLSNLSSSHNSDNSSTYDISNPLTPKRAERFVIRLCH